MKKIVFALCSVPLFLFFPLSITHAELVEWHIPSISGEAHVIRKGDRAVVLDFGYEGGGILNFLEKIKVKNIVALIVSHNDKDHIGGLFEVAQKYPEARIIKHNESNFPNIKPICLDSFEEGDRACLTLVDSNPESIWRFEWGEHQSIMFLADAQGKQLKKLCDDGIDFSANLIKIPHHGEVLNADDSLVAPNDWLPCFIRESVAENSTWAAVVMPKKNKTKEGVKKLEQYIDNMGINYAAITGVNWGGATQSRDGLFILLNDGRVLFTQETDGKKYTI